MTGDPLLRSLFLMGVSFSEGLGEKTVAAIGGDDRRGIGARERVLDFAFTPEQEAFRETLRRFALEELLPGYAARDRKGEYPSPEPKARSASAVYRCRSARRRSESNFLSTLTSA